MLEDGSAAGLSIIQLMTKRALASDPPAHRVRLPAARKPDKLPVRVTWGHTRPAASSYFVKLEADRGMTIGPSPAYQLESGETASNSRAGGGDIDGIEFVLDCPPREEPKLQKLQVIWADLLAAADADTARRLGNDAAMDPGAPRLYIRTGYGQARAASP